MAEDLSLSTSASTKHAQPLDSDAKVQAAPDNPLSEPFDSHNPGCFATKKGAAIHSLSSKKEDKNT
jgi:hypothetical protein